MPRLAFNTSGLPSPGRQFGVLPVLRCLHLVVAILSFAAGATVALSQEALGPPCCSRSTQTWMGVTGTANSYAAYGGFGYALGGSVNHSGFRVRSTAGAGRYFYDKDVVERGVARTLSITGDVVFADLLVGYQWQAGATTLKAFTGAAYSAHYLSPGDPDTNVVGEEYGIKGVLEAWTNWSGRTWSSLGISVSTAHGEFSGRGRLGYRAFADFSVGVEAGGFGNREFSGGRGGGFIRYAWDRGEIALSAGVSGDIAEPSNPYGSLTFVQKF